MWVSHIEIISAKIFTWYDSTAVDVFTVIPPWKDYHDWSSLEDRLEDLLNAGPGIESRISNTRDLFRPARAHHKKTTSTEVVIDNETSDFFTLVEVNTKNTTGAIHNISRAVSALDIDIHRAFISSDPDMVSIVFYTVDAMGEKITGQDLHIDSISSREG